jgi:uncharacterized protein (DUF427 family)
MSRAIWNGVTLADSDRCEAVDGHLYFPPDSVNREFLRDSPTRTAGMVRGVARYYDVVAGGGVNRDAAWCHDDPGPGFEGIRGYVAFWKGVSVEA